jgi:hypothetical protein
MPGHPAARTRGARKPRGSGVIFLCLSRTTINSRAGLRMLRPTRQRPSTAFPGQAINSRAGLRMLRPALRDALPVIREPSTAAQGFECCDLSSGFCFSLLIVHQQPRRASNAATNTRSFLIRSVPPPPTAAQGFECCDCLSLVQYAQRPITTNSPPGMMKTCKAQQQVPTNSSAPH